MKRFYNVYQYAAPALLVPLAYLAWWDAFLEDRSLAAAALAIPVLASYVIAGVGTNVLKLWRFDTRWKWGEFRPHHGFLLGSATSVLAWLCAGPGRCPFTVLEVLRQSFVTGTVVGFWNWLYDLYAIKSGFLQVLNRRFAENSAPEAVAADYAPVFFGAFGFAYGACIAVLRHYASDMGRRELILPLAVGGALAVIAVSVGAHALSSWLRYGDSGLRPAKKEGPQ